LRHIQVASNTKTCSHVHIQIQGTIALNKIYAIEVFWM